MRNNDTNAIALKTRDAHASMLSPAIFYKMHEGSGLVIADSLGNGPDFTVSDGTPLATNVGFYTPPAENATVYAHAAVAADVDGVLASIFDFSIEYSNILIGIDYEQGADIAGINNLLSIGKAGNTTTGSFAVQINAGELPVVQYRGVSGSATTNVTVGTDSTGSARSQLLLDVARTGANTFNITGYLNGSVSVSGDGDWSNSSALGPLGLTSGANQFGDGWVLGGYVSGSIGGAKTALMNAAAGENSKMGRFFACRLDTYHAGIAQAVALDLWRDRGEFPRSLVGL